jgi:hypothetical protein
MGDRSEVETPFQTPALRRRRRPALAARLGAAVTHAAAAATVAAIAVVAAALLGAAAPLQAQAAAAAETAAAQYALIVNGDDSFTHNYNVALALAALPRLGYATRNTFLLAPPAAATAATATAAGAASGAAGEPPAWREPATERGLREALAQLHQRLRPGDRLLVYLTGHGYRMFGRTSLGLQSGSITARELMQRLAELPFGTLVLIADQCYSGGFVDAAIALGRNVVAVSSADDRHEVRCEPWVRPLWLAAAPADDDRAGGGPASIEEAFRTAGEGLRRSGAAADGDRPRYAASGSCAGHENAFSGSPLPRRAARLAPAPAPAS